MTAGSYNREKQDLNRSLSDKIVEGLDRVARSCHFAIVPTSPDIFQEQLGKHNFSIWTVKYGAEAVMQCWTSGVHLHNTFDRKELHDMIKDIL